MTRLGAIALRGLVPALLLPVITAAAAILGNAIIHPPAGDFGGGIYTLIVTVFLFVLLGSMTLNSWLLLRHPETFASRALPERVAALEIALWVALVIWAVILFVGVPALDAAGIVLAAACMLISIAICVLALARPKGSATRVAEFALSKGQRAAALAYLVVATLVLALAAATPFIGTGYDDGGAPLGGPATWAMLPLGLPWSWPLYFVTLVGQFVLNPSGPVVYFLTPAATAIGVVANVVIGAVFLWSTDGRVALLNWFFRLRLRPEQGAPSD